MRKASPQMDPDKMLDGQSRWTEMPFTMLQRIRYLCFACLGCLPLEKGGREGSLSSAFLQPHASHTAAHICTLTSPQTSCRLSLRLACHCRSTCLWADLSSGCISVSYKGWDQSSGDCKQEAGPEKALRAHKCDQIERLGKTKGIQISTSLAMPLCTFFFISLLDSLSVSTALNLFHLIYPTSQTFHRKEGCLVFLRINKPFPFQWLIPIITRSIS